MARATLSTQAPVSTGLDATYTTVAAADGAGFTNTGNEIVHAKNDTAGAIVLTAETPVTFDGLALPDRAVTIPAGESRFLRFARAYYNQPDNTVHLDVDTDGLKLAVLR